MKLSLTASGLLDPRRLDSWVPEKRRAIRKAVEEEQKNTPAPKIEPKKVEPPGPEDGAEPEAEPDKDGTPGKDSFKLKMPELTPLPE